MASKRPQRLWSVAYVIAFPLAILALLVAMSPAGLILLYPPIALVAIVAGIIALKGLSELGTKASRSRFQLSPAQARVLAIITIGLGVIWLVAKLLYVI